MLIVINYGGGTNSTALIVEAIERGLFDGTVTILVIFADTGSERPETYAYLAIFAAWLKRHGIDLVIARWYRRPTRSWTYRQSTGALRIGQMLARHAESRLHPLAQAVAKKPERFAPKPKRLDGGVDLGGMFVAIHEDCERRDTLPSRAFGFSGCTTKWKQQPIDDYAERWAMYQRLFGGAVEWLPPIVDREERQQMFEMLFSLGNVARAQVPVERWIGYDADEPGRVARMLSKNPRSDLWKWRAPLVEWDMGRDECVETIRATGLPPPGKSACWNCPSTKKHEIAELGDTHPTLLERALKIERAAIEAGNVTSRGGLGGSLNWGEFLFKAKRHLPILEAAGVTAEYLDRRQAIREAQAIETQRILDAKVVDEERETDLALKSMGNAADGGMFDAVADGIACGCYDG
jgi:hypothetical protein